MEILLRNIGVVVGALVALLLQIVVVPALTIASAQPNALIAFVVVLSIVRPANGTLVAAFVLGLVGGAVSSYPLGLLAAVLVAVSFVLDRLFSLLDGNSQIMVAISIAVAVFAAELVYGFLLIQFGMEVSFFGLLVYRIAPCALYDCIAAFLMYPLVHRFIGPQASATQIPVAQIRTGR